MTTLTSTTIDEPQRITRGTQSLIRHTQQDTQRNVLAPYVGEIFYVAGTVQRYSKRNDRLFLCMTDVDLCPIKESQLPHEQRNYLPIDHCWTEVSKGCSVPPIATLVSNFSTIVSYTKLGGDLSHGCKPLSTVHFHHALNMLAQRIMMRMSDATDPASPTGITQKEFNSFINSLKAGYFTANDRTVYISYGHLSLKDILSLTQTVLKKLLKCLKRGRINQAQSVFDLINKHGELAVEGFTIH